jgi:hypothetical protein
MVLSGCAYALRTETVRSIGGFPGKLITCDMDLTWSLYKAGYKTTFCHGALACTYDPETFKVYTKQMRRWASGFFQNFQAHKREVFRSPSAMLVVGTLLFDLLSLPITYAFAITWVIRDPGNLSWMLPAFAISLGIHWVICTIIVTRTITWKQALLGFPCYWAANWWNKSIYLWTFIREWILGRHYMSWTGRQGRATEITPMSARRKQTLTAVAAIAAAVVAAHAITVAQHHDRPSTAASTQAEMPTRQAAGSSQRAQGGAAVTRIHSVSSGNVATPAVASDTEGAAFIAALKRHRLQLHVQLTASTRAAQHRLGAHRASRRSGPYRRAGRHARAAHSRFSQRPTRLQSSRLLAGVAGVVRVGRARR